MNRNISPSIDSSANRERSQCGRAGTLVLDTSVAVDLLAAGWHHRHQGSASASQARGDPAGESEYDAALAGLGYTRTNARRTRVELSLLQRPRGSGPALNAAALSEESELPGAGADPATSRPCDHAPPAPRLLADLDEAPELIETFDIDHA